MQAGALTASLRVVEGWPVEEWRRRCLLAQAVPSMQGKDDGCRRESIPCRCSCAVATFDD